MKILVTAFFLAFGSFVARAGEVILPYSAFGSQVAAYELIGMEWWQWDSHGDGTEREYPIKVVVFWDQSRETTVERHPVNEAKLQDFRYVEYSKAIAHLEATIKLAKEFKLDSTQIEQTLAQLIQSKKKPNKAEMATPNPPPDQIGS